MKMWGYLFLGFFISSGSLWADANTDPNYCYYHSETLDSCRVCCLDIYPTDLLNPTEQLEPFKNCLMGCDYGYGQSCVDYSRNFPGNERSMCQSCCDVSYPDEPMRRYDCNANCLVEFPLPPPPPPSPTGPTSQICAIPVISGLNQNGTCTPPAVKGKKGTDCPSNTNVPGIVNDVCIECRREGCTPTTRVSPTTVQVRGQTVSCNFYIPECR